MSNKIKPEWSGIMRIYKNKKKMADWVCVLCGKTDDGIYKKKMY